MPAMSAGNCIIRKCIVPHMATADSHIQSTPTGHAGSGPVISRILIQYPDITLKGKNQAEFQNALSRNIKQQLKHRGWHWKIGASHGRASIDIPADETRSAVEAAAILRCIPGIHAVELATWVHPGKYLQDNGVIIWDDIDAAVVSLARQYFREDASFALQINRTDKSLPVTSRQIGTRLGDLIRQHTAWDKVNLKQPGQRFYIDAHPDGFYIYAEKRKGVGGLPVGTGGRVMALLSGGIDSPVAAYSLAKRGCNVDFIHISAGHLRQDGLADTVIGKLAAQLSRYTQDSRLYILPNTYFDLALAGHNTGYELVLFRRFMMRLAQLLARQIGAAALVNGDSLGQVASQTLENLVSVSVTSMPVFRPLIGSNKEEIIETARRIGTYDISIQPYKDCCAILASHPKTRTRPDKLDKEEQERLPGYEQLLATTMADLQCLHYQYGDLTEISLPVSSSPD